LKLKFKNQDFQTDAVNSVVDLFCGQEKTNSTFSVDIEKQQSIMNDFGIGNALLINNKALLANMHEIQKRNNLPTTDELKEKRFCVEMETGTGKTYVYTKTIFELNKRYGFTKFIVVVPSVAIREGVYRVCSTTTKN
jgi:type III restriction enzyme